MRKSYTTPKARIVPINTNENISTSISYETVALRYIHQDTLDGRGTCNAYLANYGIPSHIAGEATEFKDIMKSLFAIHDYIGDEAFGGLIEDIRNGSFSCFG